MLVLNRLVAWAGGATGDDESSSPLRKLFSGDRRNDIPLGRQGGLPTGIELRPGQGGSSRSGSTVLDGSPLAWREFAWGDYAVGNGRWHSVRWRFYANGHVCFDAQMSNSSEGVDLGHVQGHRIELRERSGLLLGVWAAAFFVGRGQPALGFQADIKDDHPTVKMHFGDLSDQQAGFWLYRGTLL
jgi:hypothetical protein